MPRDEWPIKQLVEGQHFYMEDGLMVLTERYHLARGRCCGNACRHCPFDHINVAKDGVLNKKLRRPADG